MPLDFVPLVPHLKICRAGEFVNSVFSEKQKQRSISKAHHSEKFKLSGGSNNFTIKIIINYPDNDKYINQDNNNLTGNDDDGAH